MSGYFVLNVILAIWVFFDGGKRKHPKKWLYALGTIFLSWLTLPFYLAGRPLKEGEIREGGYGWNILKNFALFWTLIVFVSGFSGLIEAGSVMEEAQTEAEQVGAGLGVMLGLVILGAVWFFPMLGAMLLGFFVKNSSRVEEGPTGPLALEAASTGEQK